MTSALPLAEIVRRLPHLRNSVRFPAEPVASHPMPVRHSQGPAWFFFFCPWRGAPPEAMTFLPPMARFVIGLDGSLLEAVPTQPPDFGQSMPPRAELGTHQFDPPIRMDEYLALEADMHGALDALLPLAGAWPGAPDDQAREAARRWLRSFHRIAQTPLRPFYRSVAPDFFAWVEAVTLPVTS